MSERSIRIEPDGSVSFEVVWDKKSQPEEGRERLKVKVNPDELRSTSAIERVRSRVREITNTGKFQSVNKGLAVFGVVTGSRVSSGAGKGGPSTWNG